MITNAGRALLTAILQVAFPNKYGVWNNASEGGLKRLGLWPKFEKRSTFGDRYARMNDVLCGLCKSLGIDLWTLDALWWYIQNFVHKVASAAEIAQDKEDGCTSNPRIPKAVEERAMDVACEHYEKQGFTVDRYKYKPSRTT